MKNKEENKNVLLMGKLLKHFRALGHPCRHRLQDRIRRPGRVQSEIGNPQSSLMLRTAMNMTERTASYLIAAGPET